VYPEYVLKIYKVSLINRNILYHRKKSIRFFSCEPIVNASNESISRTQRIKCAQVFLAKREKGIFANCCGLDKIDASITRLLNQSTFGYVSLPHLDQLTR